MGGYLEIRTMTQPELQPARNFGIPIPSKSDSTIFEKGSKLKKISQLLVCTLTFY